MNDEEFGNFINSIREKLGDEQSALIADDLGTLISNNSNMNLDIKNRNEDIERLKSEKENLITANGNLLKQVSMGNEEFGKPKIEKEEHKKFNMKAAFDEKGNFI